MGYISSIFFIFMFVIFWNLLLLMGGGKWGVGLFY